MRIRVPKTLLYDFKRTLTSKSVITVMALPIVISLAIIPLASPAPSPPSNTGNNSALLYFDSGGYHFLVYSANQFGQPIGGARAQFNLSDTVHSYRTSGTTNSSGYSFTTINAQIRNNYTVSWKVTNPDGSLSSEAIQFPLIVFSPTKPPQNLTSGQIMPLTIMPLTGPTISTVVDASNASRRDIQVVYAAPDGARPTNYGLYYEVYNASNSGGGPTLALTPPSLNQSQMQLVGSLNDYHHVYVLNIPQNSKCRSQVSVVGGNGFSGPVNCLIEVEFGLFSQNGTLLQANQMPVYVLAPPPPPPIQPNSVAFQFFETVMGFFIPLIAVVGSYSSYGKDRVTGVLESVLARPVTRKGLGISRYLSTFLALAVAVVISILVVDVILEVYSGGSFIATDFVLTAIGEFLVEVAAFVGIMFLFSHLVKSTGLLIGIGIGLFLLLDLFWRLIIYILTTAMGATGGSAVYLQVSVVSDFFNPTQLVTLAYAYLTNQFQGTPIQPSAYGITIPTLVLTGILWIAWPFSLFLYRAMKRD